jgi:hypothetical protein
MLKKPLLIYFYVFFEYFVKKKNWAEEISWYRTLFLFIVISWLLVLIAMMGTEFAMNQKLFFLGSSKGKTKILFSIYFVTSGLAWHHVMLNFIGVSKSNSDEREVDIEITPVMRRMVYVSVFLIFAIFIVLTLFRKYHFS